MARRQQTAERDRSAVRIGAHAAFILAAIEAKDDITLGELLGLAAERGTPLGIGTLWRFFLTASDHARKKKAHATEQDRSDVLRRQEEWFDGQLDLDPERLAFIDETWASTNIARHHSRCQRGERLRSGVPADAGRPPPSSPACAAQAWWRRWCSMACQP